MASGPTTSWEIDGETVTDLVFLGSKITADGDCSHEITYLLGRKVMTNLDSIFKSRDITLLTKVRLVKAMVFPMTIHPAPFLRLYIMPNYILGIRVEPQGILLMRICLRLLRVAWTARRANQSILQEISPEISLEGMTIKLKLQYFGHLM